MAPSCTSGLSGVGLTTAHQYVGAQPNSTRRSLIRDLTTGRLVNAIPRATALDSNLALGIVEAPRTVLLELEVRPSSGRGLGLFAVEDIPAYTRILEDFALLSLAADEDIPELWQKYCVLPHDQRQQFDELGFSSNQLQKEELLISKLQERGYSKDEAAKMVRVQSRFMANAFKEDNDKWRATLFLTVARINHSCTPNAQTHYRPASGAKVVYSLRDINAGEEIEISYFGIHLPYPERQNRAKSWGFTCSCPACSDANTSATNNYERTLDAIRLSLQNADEVVIRYGLPLTKKAIETATSTEYPWLVSALPSLFYTLDQYLQQNQHSREERAEALESALEWECRITGPDSQFSQSRQRQLEQLKREVG